MIRIPAQPPILSIVPAELRERDEAEERALAYASGRDPAQESLCAFAPVAALLLLLAFVASALLR